MTLMAVEEADVSVNKIEDLLKTIVVYSDYAAASKAWFRSQRSPGRAEVAETALGSRRSRRSESDAFGPFWSSVIVWLLPAIPHTRMPFGTMSRQAVLR